MMTQAVSVGDKITFRHSGKIVTDTVKELNEVGGKIFALSMVDGWLIDFPSEMLRPHESEPNHWVADEEEEVLSLRGSRSMKTDA